MDLGHFWEKNAGKLVVRWPKIRAQFGVMSISSTMQLHTFVFSHIAQLKNTGLTAASEVYFHVTKFAIFTAWNVR